MSINQIREKLVELASAKGPSPVRTNSNCERPCFRRAELPLLYFPGWSFLLSWHAFPVQRRPANPTELSTDQKYN